MTSRAPGTSHRRARKTARHSLTAAIAVLALGAGTLPAFASPTPAPADPGPGSVWGKEAAPLAVPPVKVGSTKPVAGEAEAAPSEEKAAWRAAQKERARTGKEPKGERSAGARSSSGARSNAADALVYVPEGQGSVPWHHITDFRITDSLVARINLSNGNLMLAGTDFEVAGVGQKLRLARTYNSLDAPWGKVSQRWWQEYERYLQVITDEVVLYDATGAAVRFTQKADGTFTTPKGYAKDLKKNADGTYTLTDRKSGVKDTYNAHGTLTKVTDRNRARSRSTSTTRAASTRASS